MASEDALRATELAKLLVGQSFVQVCVGAGDAQLNFTGGFGITLESPIAVGPGGESVAAPYTLEGLALLLPLLNGDVTDVEISEGGHLSLTVGATALRCRSGSGFEAWNYRGPSGELVCQLPSGGLAIWPAR